MTEADADIRPCIECGKVHENIGPFDSNGKRMIDNWRDPHDNHAYYPPSWEDFARSLAEARATAGAVEPRHDVDELAQIIRRVDGNHSLGAGALAEAIIENWPGGTRRFRDAIARAANEGRNVLPDATDDEAAVIEAWALNVEGGAAGAVEGADPAIASSDFAAAVSALHHAYYAIPAGVPTWEQINDRLPALYAAIEAVLDSAARYGGLIATVADADRRGIPVYLNVGRATTPEAPAPEGER